MRFRFQIGSSQPAAKCSPAAPARGARPFSALLVAASSNLGRQFLALTSETSEIEVIHRLDCYPSLEALDALAGSRRPDLVCLDFTSDRETACRLTQGLTALHPGIHVIGLDQHGDPETLVRALRVGASEFLRAPFELDEMRGVLARVDRLRRSSDGSSGMSGRVLVFSSAKPGAGATTLANHTALRLGALTGQRTLLVDLNLEAGLLGADLEPAPRFSVLDGLRQARSLDVTTWSKLTERAGHIDLLAAPREPYDGEVEAEELHSVLSSARQAYDWIVLDLPVITHFRSLLGMEEADQGFIVTTTELPSLHLTRRGSERLQQLGFGRERFQILANRAIFSDLLDQRVMNDVLGVPVFATLPDDYRTLHDLRRFGEMPSERSLLGAALERFVSMLVAGRSPSTVSLAPAYGLRPAMAR